MEKAYIEIGKKQYLVDIAREEDEKTKGLQGVEKLPKDEGMLFIFPEETTVEFWMKDTLIDLDVIFIDDDYEVISVQKGKAGSEEILAEDDVSYVLEVNVDSGIQVGDEMFIEDDKDEDDDVKMLVIGPDGKVQMELDGGERIFSRQNTKTLIRMAKRAQLSGEDRHFKALGNKIFKYMDIQDKNDPEYVSLS